MNTTRMLEVFHKPFGLRWNHCFCAPGWYYWLRGPKELPLTVPVGPFSTRRHALRDAEECLHDAR